MPDPRALPRLKGSVVYVLEVTDNDGVLHDREGFVMGVFASEEAALLYGRTHGYPNTAQATPFVVENPEADTDAF